MTRWTERIRRWKVVKVSTTCEYIFQCKCSTEIALTKMALFLFTSCCYTSRCPQYFMTLIIPGSTHYTSKDFHRLSTQSSRSKQKVLFFLESFIIHRPERDLPRVYYTSRGYPIHSFVTASHSWCKIRGRWYRSWKKRAVTHEKSENGESKRRPNFLEPK